MRDFPLLQTDLRVQFSSVQFSSLATNSANDWHYEQYVAVCRCRCHARCPVAVHRPPSTHQLRQLHPHHRHHHLVTILLTSTAAVNKNISCIILHSRRYNQIRLHTAAAAADPNKTAPFLQACSKDGRLSWPVQSSTYVDPRAAQGLEAPPRTSTSHLATDRRWAGQPRTELSVVTRPGSRTMEAARGNGYAPVRGLPVIVMTIQLDRIIRLEL